MKTSDLTQLLTDLVRGDAPGWAYVVALIFVIFVVYAMRGRGEKGGRSELQAAVQKGNLAKVRQLIQAGVDINAARHGPAIIVACKRGNADVVRELIMAGANVNVSTPTGQTPLSAAKGKPEIIRILERAGALEKPSR